MTTLSANDQLVDLFMERSIDILRLEAGTRNKVFKILNDLEGDLVAQIAKVDPTEGQQQRRLQKLLDTVRTAIRAGYRNNSQLMAREIREIIDQESTWTANALNQSIGIDFVKIGFTRSQLEALASDVMIQGAPSADWWSRQAAGLAERFADQMRIGVAAGETNAELVARTRQVMEISRNSAMRLVRSSVQTAANAGREVTYANNDDIIEALQWHATLDTRTSFWCITRDGHLYNNDAEHKPQDDGPPWLQGPGAIHWNCRSTSVPVLKSWQSLGIAADELPNGTRASMDGQVPADQTFEGWLKKQSEGRQNAVLGVEVAKLWRDGRLSFSDLLNAAGQPLTTEELKAKAERKD